MLTDLLAKAATVYCRNFSGVDSSYFFSLFSIGPENIELNKKRISKNNSVREI